MFCFMILFLNQSRKQPIKARRSSHAQLHRFRCETSPQCNDTSFLGLPGCHYGDHYPWTHLAARSWATGRYECHRSQDDSVACIVQLVFFNSRSWLKRNMCKILNCIAWHINCFSLTRNLWSYTPICNAPEGCRLRPANNLLSLFDARACIRRGYTIHHIADFLRLQAVKHHWGATAATGSRHLLSKANSDVAEQVRFLIN